MKSHGQIENWLRDDGTHGVIVQFILCWFTQEAHKDFVSFLHLFSFPVSPS